MAPAAPGTPRPEPPRLSGHALWIRPEGETLETLRAAVTRLARRLGGPVFEPHLTLCGRVPGSRAEARAACRRLAAGLSPIPVSTAGLGMGEEYFRALYLPVAASPALWKAHLEAMEAFQPDREIAFFPHLSLFYGELPAEEKLAAAAELPVLSGWHGLAREILLVSAEGTPEEWQVVEAIPLGASSSPGSSPVPRKRLSG